MERERGLGAGREPKQHDIRVGRSAAAGAHVPPRAAGGGGTSKPNLQSYCGL